jgi:hypothetical protein
MRTPALIAGHADVDILQIDCVILQVNYIGLFRACIAWTASIRTLDILGMRKYRILRSELIQKNLVAFTGSLANSCFHNQTSLCILF